MMASYSETEDQFFVTSVEISSVSDLSSDFSEGCLSSGLGNCALGYEFWTKEPDSVDERRGRFLRWMGLSSDWHKTSEDEEENSHHEDAKMDIVRLKDNGEAVLANLDSEPQFFSSRSLQSFRSYDDTYLLEDGASEENLTWKIKNLDNGTELVMDELADDDSHTILREVGSDKMISLHEFQKILGSSSLVQRLLRKDWFLSKPEINPSTGSTSQRVCVNVCKKQLKELSSLYTGQEFSAHEGSILSMKFSPDGLYLASAGVDGVVRVWKVLEDDIVNKFNTQDIDPSCLYFSLNHFSKLAPLDVAKERDDHMKSLKKSSDSACVILPPKGFQLSEKPLHEFHGHTGEHLLSSSVDKTARLWRVGHDQCQGVYLHNNYVTCVEFNPVDDNHFISGSIDGKLRIWEVRGGRVIDWTDIREIVTAVCNRRSVSQVPAAFTSDGQHIVSATEDSKVRVWNYSTEDQKSSRIKNVRSSETFLSRNASIAIPWCGLKNKLGALPGSILRAGHFDEKLLQKFPASFPDCLTTSLGFLVDALYKGSTTWPEEKLPKLNQIPVKPSVYKSEFKFLKHAMLSAFNSPHSWGLVIVTAGWDGCIRTFLNYGLPIRF
ncbi:hypothetical protein DH2020_020363 [Rehmannia glutinosa]|uniref:Uncharacterized protein n=1 Tax=Rehmannia glutinosa TaxID=99300 RepID=A0ABR0WK63_REHGL